MKQQVVRVAFFLILVLLAGFFPLTSLQAQNKETILESHYLFPEFIEGTVKMKNGDKKAALFNYNKLSEEMMFYKRGVKMAMFQLNSVDTVCISSRKFVPYDKVFYEVLVEAPWALFVQHISHLLAPGKPAAFGGTTQTASVTSYSSILSEGSIYKLKLPDNFIITDASLFWIKHEGEFYKATNSRQVMRIFPKKAKEIKQFIKENSLDLKKEVDMITLVLKCNELVN